MAEAAHPAVAGGQLKLSYKGTADGSYPGFDRFGRVAWQTWTSADGDTVHDRLAYGYDRASNRIWKMDYTACQSGNYAARHEAYAYDGLHRLVKAQRGMLKSGQQGGLTAPFGGDANADGVVDWDNDYLALQNGLLGLGQGWAFGDFDGNGVIDEDNDYLIFVNGILFPPTRSVVGTWQWSLDALGNWRGYLYDAGDGTTWDLDQTRTHNAVNEITDLDGGAWTDPAHDAAGNMTRAPRPGQESTPAETLLNVYDAWNRLVKVFKDSNTNGTLDTETDAPVAEYRYDGLGRRIQKTVEGSPDVTYDYYYNEGRQVLEVWKNGDDDHPLEQYVWDGRYVHSPCLRWRDGNCDGDYADEGDSVLYYCNDANFNVTALVDAASGAVVERYWYEPYGQPHVCDGDWTPRENNASAYANEILFTGHRLDPETGLYHTPYRPYHPTLGRFPSPDPIRYADGMNLYEYVLSSPTVFVDPSGLWIDHDQFTKGPLDNTFDARDRNLKPKFPDLSPECKAWATDTVMAANRSQDSDEEVEITDKSGKKKKTTKGNDLRRHYNRSPEQSVADANAQYKSYLAEEIANFKEELAKVKDKCDTAEEETACTRALEALGRYSHSVQDYFAHAVLADTGKGGPAWGKGITGNPRNLNPRLKPSSYRVKTRGAFSEHGFVGHEPADDDTAPDSMGNAGYTLRRSAATDYTQAEFQTYIPVWYAKCKCCCPPKAGAPK